MPLTVSLSSVASRVAIGDEIEIFVAVLTGDFGASLFTPAAGTRVSLAMRLDPGDGRLLIPDHVIFDGRNANITIRARAAAPGRLRLTATADLPSEGLRPTRRSSSTISHITISSSPAIRAAGACTTTPATAPPAVRSARWQNWAQNIQRDLQIARPRGGTSVNGIAQVRAAIVNAETAGSSIGVQGTGWSFSNCVVASSTTRVLETDSLQSALNTVLPRALRHELVAERSQFLHVEAGIKLHRLNVILEGAGLAMPTLGGSRGQSLAGVISTGVHGSHVNAPPVADAVRALHIVAPGGQEWWVEPATDPITDPFLMSELRDDGTLCRSIRIVYDDDLFNAALVAVGCAGFIYSVVLKARPAYNLASATSNLTWARAQNYIRSRIVRDVRLPVFVEINVNPADMSCILVERFEVPATSAIVRRPAGSPSPDTCVLAAAGILIGPAALATFFAAIGDYISRTTAEIAAWNLVPIYGQVRAAQMTAESLDTVVEWHELLVRLGLAAADSGNEQRIADLMPVAINLIWKIGLFVVQGREIVNQIQRMITQQQRPTGFTILPSYEALTGQPTIPADIRGYDGSQTHPLTEKLVQSFEYAVAADRAIEFVDLIAAEVSRLRRGPDALIVNINLRFSRRSRALIGMQQFDRTAHVEVYTFKGLDGNGAFHASLERIVRDFGAIPHWGQLHEASAAIAPLFGENLRIWQWAMNVFATAGIGTPALFWSTFARDRRLLNFAPGVRAHPVTRRSGLAGSRAISG